MPPDLPRFSLRLHQGLTPQACGAVATSAEADGFHTLWFAENPFGRAILPRAAGLEILDRAVLSLKSATGTCS